MALITSTSGAAALSSVGQSASSSSNAATML
jgi:hypothetical protein